MQLEPNDRLLVLSQIDAAGLRSLAQQVEPGVVVVLSRDESIYDLRRDMADSVNVMCQWIPDSVIPWRDYFFGKVLDVRGDWPLERAGLNELVRVLHIGGLCELSRPVHHPELQLVDGHLYRRRGELSAPRVTLPVLR